MGSRSKWKYWFEMCKLGHGVACVRDPRLHPQHHMIAVLQLLLSLALSLSLSLIHSLIIKIF